MKLRYKIANGFLILLVVGVASLAAVLSYEADCGPAPTTPESEDLMKAVVYRCYGSPDVLELVDITKPVPDVDEVLVRIHAAAVNPLDWHYMRGSPYLMRLGAGIGAPNDTRLGVDFAGTVEAAGTGVSRFKPGDAVFGGWNGAFAEYVAIPENRALVHIPGGVSFEQAASMPIAAVTALQALRDSGKLRSGEKVLINGASGGVGTFAVQIAKELGAEVTGVCSTRNVEMVRSIGADHVVDYTKENYTESGEKYDLIVDMVGNHPLLANRKVLKPEGRFVIVGAEKGDWLRPLWQPIKALILSPFVDQEFGMMLAQLNREDFEILAGFVQKGSVLPVIDRRYSLNDIAEAMRYSESGRARGKIIVNVN